MHALGFGFWVWHLNEGYLYREIAQFLGVHLTTVQDWVHRFSTEGLDGLRESPRSGATRKLAASQEEAFKAAVMALGEQREGGRITGHTIRALLAEQFDVHCCLNSVDTSVRPGINLPVRRMPSKIFALDGGLF